MTTHAEAMVERLPTLYSDGDLVRGLAAVFGLQLEILDEEARIVQRAHWFDTTVELVEAAALGALLDIAPETWQELDEYRAWFHALRTARLRYGAVCTEALTVFTQSYADEFQKRITFGHLPISTPGPLSSPRPGMPWSRIRHSTPPCGSADPTASSRCTGKSATRDWTPRCFPSCSPAAGTASTCPCW